jgi:GNAT superfamily N-acetyltransferase
MDTITLRRAVANDTDTLSATLTEAFYQDPVMSWCYPDAPERATILPAFFRVVLDAATPHGGVETAEEGAATSVWIPPEAEIDGERLAADLGAVSGPYEERALAIMGLLDEHHPTDQAHQYLFLLGTREAWQSHGLGSALLRSVLSRCDVDGVPAYLEATSERNRSLYERHGFETVEMIGLPGSPPPAAMTA